jgi:hypothetical protein
LRRDAQIYERTLRQFQTERGLFIIGAGASVGCAPFGADFWRAAPLDYLRNVGSFSAEIPAHDALTTSIIAANSGLSVNDIYPDREFRPGTDLSLHHEILHRMPDLFTRLKLKNLLSRQAYSLLNPGPGALPRVDSYAVFELFHPSLIANYNHDGLASHYCASIHHVLDMHGTVPVEYGSPSTTTFIEALREVDLPAFSDDILMSVPESFFDNSAAQRRFRNQLLKVEQFTPDFIAIIGYSFFQNDTAYLDEVSLKSFLHTRRHFRGPIYVIQPQPGALSSMIADRFGSKTVFPISAYWNVLSHAMMLTALGQGRGKSLDYICQYLLDKFGDKIALPQVI